MKGEEKYMILKISIVLIVGIICGKLANLVKLPNVSGYLIAGLLLGPSLINYISSKDTQSFEIVNELALSFIAFSIGSEFVIHEMVKYGKRIFVITLMEVVGAVLVVFIVMYILFQQSFALSIIIASMSAATAPAATLMVIKQYRANGPLTRTILPVVALDDIFGIMIFGLAIPIAAMSIRGVEPSFINIVINPLIEILGSLVLGFGLGVITVLITRKIKTNDDLQITSLIAIGIGVGVSTLLGLSPLLTNIMIGFVIVNYLPRSEKVFTVVNQFVPVFYILFFVLAGAMLDINILKTIGLIGIAYIFARGIGKIIGSLLGCKIMKVEKSVSKYLGFCLLPQGGVSIGLSVIVRQQIPELAVTITTIIMCGILVYEIVGPILTKIALHKAGEENGMDVNQIILKGSES